MSGIPVCQHEAIAQGMNLGPFETVCCLFVWLMHGCWRPQGSDLRVFTCSAPGHSHRMRVQTCPS